MQEARGGMQTRWRCVSEVEQPQWLNERSSPKHGARLIRLRAAARQSDAPHSPTGNRSIRSPILESSRPAAQPTPDSTRTPAAHPLPCRSSSPRAPSPADNRCASAVSRRRADGGPISRVVRLNRTRYPRRHTTRSGNGFLPTAPPQSGTVVLVQAAAHSCRWLLVIGHCQLFLQPRRTILQTFHRDLLAHIVFTLGQLHGQARYELRKLYSERAHADWLSAEGNLRVEDWAITGRRVIIVAWPIWEILTR